MANKYTFWKLISDKKIVIPIIQRDYAQGREGKEFVRKSFLEQLGKAIFENEPTELDFVYGTEKDGTMYPLDGQQRLTTLWLLHWFVAYKAGKLVEVKDTLKKFSYETRTSSREFCEKLCELEFTETCDIVTHITNQTWFFSRWKQDPTIQAMLRMLCGTNNSNSKDGEFIDGIEELFKGKYDFETYWRTMTLDYKITFNFLPMNTTELPISDDLYIKMNARGKDLTNFENFKAELVRWIYHEDNKQVWEGNINIDTKRANYVSAIDNEWTDIFWANGKSLGRVDELFFAFINRYFLNEYISSKTEDGKYLLNDKSPSNDNRYSYLMKDNKVAYTTLEIYPFWQDNKSFAKKLTKLETILNNISKSKCLNNKLFVPSWNNNFKFIPEYAKDEKDSYKLTTDDSGKNVNDIYTVSQVERIAFYAFCKYFYDGDFQDTSLKEWNRFIWNIISVSDDGLPFIRTIGRMQNAIELIDRIDTHSVYKSLEKQNTFENPSNCLQEQFNEEIEKAKQILYGNTDDLPTKPADWNDEKSGEWNWENAIIEIENFAFFEGTIRFLYYSESNKVDWSENNFIVKRNYAKSLFCEKDKYKSSMKTLMKYVPIGTWCDKTYSVDWESGSQWKRLLTDNKLTSHIDIFLKDVQGNRSNSTEEIEEFQRYFEHKYKDKNKGTYWILKDYERFDYVYTCYTNKMENASNDLVYPILPKRTTLLNECENKDDRFIVDDDFKVLVDGNYLYKGFRLKFTFKGNKFEWYQGNNVEYDVYLIENNEYKLKDSEAENDIDKYYCFNIDKNENANSFIQKLEDLIKEAYSNDISE